jgi:hypothetical protein
MKILVACPTADVKAYCFEDWVNRAKNLTYPNYDIYMCDNSDKRDFYSESKSKYEGIITMERISTTHSKSVPQVMAKSHEKCRLQALKGGYDFLLHLESDIFPPLDIIEKLMAHKKKIVGALYHIESGDESKLMIQQIENFGNAHRQTFNLDETDLDFVDGELKQVHSCGLGCTLIHRSILEKYPFRYEEGAPVHPDSFFFGDLDSYREKVFVDTSILCEHENKSLTRF